MNKLDDIENFGIFPAPWKYDGTSTGGKIIGQKSTGRRWEIAEVFYSNSDDETSANACMLSAAPELYSALWDHCFGESTTVNCAKCGGNDHGDGIEHCSKDCPLYKSRAALAKASGITR